MRGRIIVGVSALLLGMGARGLAAGGGEALVGSHPATPKVMDYAEEYARSNNYAGPFTQENLERLKKALEVPTTRMAALRELIDFAGLTLYQVGSVMMVYQDGSTEIRRQAATSARGAADEATVMAALKGEDPILGFWGIWNFGVLKNRQVGIAELERLAKGNDETLRSRAAERLSQEGGRGTLEPLVATEKSPWVIESMLGNNTFGKFNARLEELLKDPDAAVREKVINFLSGSWTRAAARQLWIDAPMMDGVLACAQGKGADAGAALEAFKQLTNQDQLADAGAAAAWWKAHRSDWELARYPRWQTPNGSRIYAAIQTTGAVGGVMGWKATITLENRSREKVYVNLSDIARLNWMLYDKQGERAVDPADTRAPVVGPEWLEMGPGDTLMRNVPMTLKPGPSLKPGRYMLRSHLFLGLDSKGLPEGAALHQGEVPLPLIWVEVMGVDNEGRAGRG